MSENDGSQQFGAGAQPPETPPGEPAVPQPPAAATPGERFTPQPATGPTPITNTSGTGGPVPEEIKGWNWGAFWLTWIWGIGHSVWLSLLVFVPVLGLIWQIVLGIKGNEWAWQNRRFDSIEQFKQTQAVWSKWGWIVFAVELVLAILGVILVVVLAGAAAIGAHGG